MANAEVGRKALKKSNDRAQYCCLVNTADYAEQFKQLDATLRNVESVLDVDRMRRDKAELEQQASAPDLWEDQARAQEVTSKLAYLNGEISRIERLRARLDDAQVLLGLAESESDPGSL